jgi:hypothetical protein
MTPLSIGRTITLRYCTRCERFASGFARTRCGDDGTKNMRAECPTELVDVTVVGLPGSRPDYKRQVPA